jgi:hypothetical protein
VIIRILAEGQFEVADDLLDELNALDATLEAAVESGDQDATTAALGALLDRVRTAGTDVALEALVPSDLVLPFAGATLAEVRDLLSEDGLIPG